MPRATTSRAPAISEARHASALYAAGRMLEPFRPTCHGVRAMRGLSFLRRGLLALMALALGGCGYNQIQGKDEAVKAGWPAVLNQYQRRADLIPDLAATVKGYAAHEQKVLAADGG